MAEAAGRAKTGNPSTDSVTITYSQANGYGFTAAGNPARRAKIQYTSDTSDNLRIRLISFAFICVSPRLTCSSCGPFFHHRRLRRTMHFPQQLGILF